MIEVGVDIEEVSRFNKYAADDDFLRAIFTPRELDYCFSTKKPARHLAARFCAKEAFFKATSALSISFSFNEIELLNKENGKPYFNLPDCFSGIKTSVSLSHDKTKAIAMVIVKTDNGSQKDISESFP